MLVKRVLENMEDGGTEYLGSIREEELVVKQI